MSSNCTFPLVSTFSYVAYVDEPISLLVLAKSQHSYEKALNAMEEIYQTRNI